MQVSTIAYLVGLSLGSFFGFFIGRYSHHVRL